MALRFLADENFNNDVICGAMREMNLDIVRIQDTPLVGIDDARLLAWAAEQGRIVVTHDRATMPFHARQRVSRGESMPGVLVFDDRMPLGEAIAEFLLIATCSGPSDWDGQTTFIPL